MDERITRRTSLVQLGGVIAGGVALGACGSGSAPKATSSRTTASRTTPSSPVRCVLAPEQTEGPYYIAGERLRRDITEGHPGAPLTLRLSVLDASACKAIAGAAVDVWHCDAAGAYSGFSSGGTATFLRGVQRTGADGVATFDTIYPGWYPGRTVHVHVKVHAGGNVVHTGQLYFPDDLTDAVYRRAPYNSRPARDTRNANDSVYGSGGASSLLTIARRGNAYTGEIAMGVRAA